MRHQNGFSMIEVILVLVLTGVIALFGSSFMLYGIWGYQQSTNNSTAALNMKPTVDVLGTLLVDVIEVTCLTSASGEVEFTFVNSLDEEETLKASSNQSYISMSGFHVVEGISSPQLTYTVVDGNVDYFTLTYTLDVIDKPQVMRFSPRTIIPASFTACP